jgi:hypothetical protein
MAIPSGAVARTIGATFSAANHLYVDAVVPGRIVWNDGAANHTILEVDAGGTAGDEPYSTPGITEIVSFSGSANGFWTA